MVLGLRIAAVLTAGIAIDPSVFSTPAVARPGIPVAGSELQGRASISRRYATTVGALNAYPVFFNSQSVIVRGAVRVTGDLVTLVDGSDAVVMLGQAATGLTDGGDAAHEVTGVFFDVGRLAEGDPRLTGLEVQRVSEARLSKPWPGVGELLVLVPDAIVAAEGFPAASLRALALEPGRYADAQVTVTGRFRGRNLYGDQPNAPGRSRWDFVLQSADASIWVTGRRPRGDGFDFNVESRLDTSRWVEVSGTVSQVRDLVLIEAASIRLAKAPAESTAAEPVIRLPTVGPQPEVVFSTPVGDEIDVSPSGRVRVQFSRDLDPESLKGQLRLRYLGAPETGATALPEIYFATAYDQGTRVLEIRFVYPLEPYRTVQLQLLEGIRATDGATLVPWTLTFSTGG